MRRKKLLSIAVLAFGFVLVMASGLGIAYTDGTGDQDFEYNGGGICASCHASPGSGTITATASTLSPTTGQPITVTVSVTAAELGASNIIGVFLVRVLETSNSMPSVDGWTILSDPNGGTVNYVERTAAGVGSKTDFIWSLNAPTSTGTYKLYARAQHGTGSSQGMYMDFTAGLTFDVRTPGVGEPSIDHQPPQNIRPRTQILINATIVNATSAILSWKNETMTTSLDITMTNTSTPQGDGWLYSAIIPAQDTATQISYSINATGPAGSVQATYSLAVTEVPHPTGVTSEQQLVWIMTVVATVLVTIAIIAIVFAMFSQRLKTEKEE